MPNSRRRPDTCEIRLINKPSILTPNIVRQIYNVYNSSKEYYEHDTFQNFQIELTVWPQNLPGRKIWKEDYRRAKKCKCYSIDWTKQEIEIELVVHLWSCCTRHPHHASHATLVLSKIGLIKTSKFLFAALSYFLADSSKLLCSAYAPL